MPHLLSDRLEFRLWQPGDLDLDLAEALRRVEALFTGHNPASDASRARLARLGFRHTHDELYPPTGLLHPSYRLDRAQ
jgi:hypothetical protein